MIAQTLDSYIEEYHRGNASEYARSIDKGIFTVQRWLKANALLVDGEIYTPARMRQKQK